MQIRKITFYLVVIVMIFIFMNKNLFLGNLFLIILIFDKTSILNLMPNVYVTNGIFVGCIANFVC